MRGLHVKKNSVIDSWTPNKSRYLVRSAKRCENQILPVPRGTRVELAGKVFLRGRKILAAQRQTPCSCTGGREGSGGGPPPITGMPDTLSSSQTVGRGIFPNPNHGIDHQLL